MITPEKLDFWIKNNLNVLMIGEKGVGKTHLTVDAFKRNNLRFKYFSAPTLDPYVDLIGIPREKRDSQGNSFLEFIQPRELANDEIDCIFIDEISRAHYKVKNAILELIQFKSVNGRKFNNLRFVWAAMNPPDSGRRYQVEELDDAQWDRFQVHVNLEYKPDAKFFIGKFGEKGKAAIEWWNNIDKKLNYLVSPRRLEYALEYNLIGGDLRDILPKEVNVSELNRLLGTGPVLDRLKKIVNDNDKVEAEKLVKDSNMYAVAEKYIIADEKYINLFLPYLSDEKIVTLYGLNNQKISQFFYDQVNKENESGKVDSGRFVQILRDIIKAKTNAGLVKKASDLLRGQGISEVKKPDNLNEVMQKTQELANKKLIKEEEKQTIYDNIRTLYVNNYQSGDKHNAESMQDVIIKLCAKLNDKNILDKYKELPDISVALTNLIKSPESLIKQFSHTKESLATFEKRMKDFETPF